MNIPETAAQLTDPEAIKEAFYKLTGNLGVLEREGKLTAWTRSAFNDAVNFALKRAYDRAAMKAAWDSIELMGSGCRPVRNAERSAK